LVKGSGTLNPLSPTARPAIGAIKRGLVKIARATFAPVEQSGDDRGRRTLRPEHQEAHWNTHKADIAVGRIQSLDAGVGDAPSPQPAHYKGHGKGDGKSTTEGTGKAELLDLIRRDLGHRREHQRWQSEINREPIEIVGRRLVEHAEESADEPGKDQREDRQCGVEDGVHGGYPGRFGPAGQLENLFFSSR
jgi:hypothetical protein